MARWLLVAAVLGLGAACSSEPAPSGPEPAAQAKPAPMQPKAPPDPTLASDGYPAGSASPEGAAVDLARAFIKADSRLFKETCVAPLRGEGDTEYAEFLSAMGADMDRIKASAAFDTERGPKEVTRVYRARPLSR